MAQSQGRHSKPNSKTSKKASHSAEDMPLKKKKRSRVKLIVLLCVLVLVLAGAGVFLFITITSAQHDKAREQFNDGINLMQQADETIVALDTAVNEQVTLEKLDSLQETIDSAPAAKEQLDEATAVFDGITEELVNDDDVNVIEQAKQGADARREMLDLGVQLVTYDIAAMKSANAFTEAWSAIADADTRLRTALALVASANIETVATAKEEGTAAIADLDKALVKLDESASYLKGTDFSVIKNYVMTKREAITYAIASDDAYLAKNAAEMQAQTDNYNAADARVVELAKALPSDPSQIIVSAYEALTADLRSKYVDARSRAASADAIVRDYLGINETVTNDRGIQQQTSTT